MNLEELRARKGFYLRHGRRDLSRQPAAAGRAGISGELAERKRQAVSVPDELVRAFAQGAAAEAAAHGTGYRRGAFLHQCACDRRVSQKQAPGCTAFVIGAPGLWNALYDVGVTTERRGPGLCDRRRDGKL